MSESGIGVRRGVGGGLVVDFEVWFELENG